ncbi:DUF5682 family protein [Clostridium sp. AWRP]|uniref:DUF5682 family protein n=1 Tax=Clostridium sp. AWRP TaxID=2212991 RepID=UPI001FAB21C5|nr:DUF5682 family protein [Clostridium sp. AWRP]
MEKLLRSKEMDKINKLFNAAFDLRSNLVFFPIRHHSPACSYHLRNTIQEYLPQIILIEGPVDGNNIEESLSHEDSNPPFAIYYSYSDSKGLIDDTRGKYRCYYPFLDYSPELIGIREGKKKNIETRFIDLSYADILINSKKGKGLLKKEDKLSYNDDYFFEENEFIEELCKREGCRSFNEFWEKLFEIQGLYISKEDFVKNMLSYCYLSRICSAKEDLISEGCIARETFMASKIQEACSVYNKVLVITGGFHTYGIIDLLNKKVEFRLKKIDEKDKGVYVMPYSMEALDQLNGYSSGMPFPNFYEGVWKKLNESYETVYKNCVLSNIIQNGKKVRKNDGCLSTFDEICAFDMAQGLSNLRGKRQPGVYELIDSITSSFIKGDLNISTEDPLKVLYKDLTGNKIGKLCRKADVPPLVHDFKDTCAKYKLKINTTIKQEISLDIFSSKRHREISCLMHRMTFLNTNFSRLIKGPNIFEKRNVNLIRETWYYKWNTQVDAALIENSVYGGTLEEASTSLIKKNMNECGKSAENISKLLVLSFNMGLDEIFNSTINSLKDIIAEDSSIYSLINCLYYLNYIYTMRELYFMNSMNEVKNIIFYVYSKICILIPNMASVNEEEALKGVNSLKEVFNIVMKRELDLDDTLLKEALFSLLRFDSVNAGIEGAASGILYGLNELEAEEAAKSVEGYIFGTKEKALKAPSFLNGLFSTARDLVFVEGSILKSIDKFINEVEDEDFIRIIPQLRLAFSYFIPREVDEIGEKVAKNYKVSKVHFDELKVISPEILKLGSEIDKYAAKEMEQSGII